MAGLSATIARTTAPSPLTLDITAKGGADYMVANGDNYVYKRKNVTSLFGTPTSTWSFPDNNDTYSGYEISGTDGKPSPATFAITRYYGGFTSPGQYWEVTAPAGLAERTLELTAHAYGGSSFSITATLSDGSVSPLTLARDTDGTGSGNFGFYQLTYSAGSDSQTVTIRVTCTATGAVIRLGHLWLSDEESSGVTGTVAVTTANDTSSASGTTTVTGTSARTNANDTSSASGTTTIVASSATTNAADTSNASGSIGQSISGSVTYTNVNDTSSASGTTTVTGTSTRTNNNDASSATGTTTIIATSAINNANDTLIASGVTGTISGTVAYTNNNDIAYAYDFLPTSTSAGVSSSFYKRRRIIIEREEEKEEEPEVIVRKVKRLIARKITNKQIAQKVQEQVIEQMQFQSIDLTQAQKLIDDLKQQEILARIRKKQMQDDEEAIQFFI